MEIPPKVEVSEAQTYFAVQTRKQEIQDDQTDDEKREALRDRVRDANGKLNGVAKDAGVQRFGICNDAGYKGLYGGLGASDIKAVKGIPSTDDLLDRCGRAELAMNEFSTYPRESSRFLAEKILGNALRSIPTGRWRHFAKGSNFSICRALFGSGYAGLGSLKQNKISARQDQRRALGR